MRHAQVQYALERLRLQYALERLRQLLRRAEPSIDQKHTRKKRVVTVERVRNYKAAERAKEKLQDAYNNTRDEIVLGDEAQALKLIQAFKKKVSA